MDKLALLKRLSFGHRVAEDETAELAKYFVETDQWDRIVRGEIDVIQGEKGAGKSAIYALLGRKEDEFFDKNILLIPAETPRGAPAFKDLQSDPPTAEQEFVGLWKLYMLAILANKMREYGFDSDEAHRVYGTLESVRLIDREYDLRGLLRAAQELARRLFKAESIEGGINLDPASGTGVGVTGKITFREPDPELRARGFLSVDALIRLADRAFGRAGFKAWILLDRLDVAFAETHELETNALRALFRAYRDMAGSENISLKIFLRSDIWKRITETGFREATHITKVANLEWDSASLLNLMIRRVLANDILIETLGVDKSSVLGNFEKQKELFYRLFPAQVEQGRNKSSTLDWMVSRCADGTDRTAPRELIHLLTSLREKEIARLERGEPPASGEQLFDRPVFKAALPIVSDARLRQNLIAENPELKEFIIALEGAKTEQSVESLAAVWNIPLDVAQLTAGRLVEIGFFQPRSYKDEGTTFWVPFLYRDALSMVQGRADEI